MQKSYKILWLVVPQKWSLCQLEAVIITGVGFHGDWRLR